MGKIELISSSIRIGRNSHRIALFLERLASSVPEHACSILDLNTLSLPLSEERMEYLDRVPEGVEQFARRVQRADGIVLIVPEYNGGYPASLKNAIDLLHKEWRTKPVAFATVSTGAFGGSQVITSLQFVLWKMGALTVPGPMHVPFVDGAFGPDGTPNEPEIWEERGGALLKRLGSYIRAATHLR
ncbi:MAG: NAD(P)H-dependent oxidoreductase [Flavobacteriales bacterium]|nr:NAD(P)H-dependent oxidoreductase [Flavobacteriales bacterium]